MSQTKLENMINPEVMADMISAELPNAIKFSGVAPVDTTLEGRAGSTITVPFYKYIGDASDVAEGGAINYALLDTDDNTYTVKKAGIGVEITDEALLSGYGDPAGEAMRQIRMSIASKIDNDTVTCAKTTSLSLEHDVDLDLIDAVEAVFADDDNNVPEGQLDSLGVLYCSFGDAAKLRKLADTNWTRASEMGDRVLVSGAFGELLGWEIVRSKKIDDGEPIFVKAGAMKTFLKRDVMVESARDIDYKVTKITGDAHYVVALVDETKVVKVTSPSV